MGQKIMNGNRNSKQYTLNSAMKYLWLGWIGGGVRGPWVVTVNDMCLYPYVVTTSLWKFDVICQGSKFHFINNDCKCWWGHLELYGLMNSSETKNVITQILAEAMALKTADTNPAK